MGTMLAWLHSKGFKPTRNSPNLVTPNTPAVVAPNGHPDAKICAIHNAQMKRREREGQVWYSHKLADDSWCKGE
jgi:hypothetical protein